ncbi:unnamed protein product, partial [Dibothriocephalus latus]
MWKSTCSTETGNRYTNKWSIHEIFPEGVLAKDGRLQPGDRIIAVNHKRLCNMSFEDAVNTIAHAFSGIQPIASDADLATLAAKTAT